MNTIENDPDTLQNLDELDRKWVRFWRKATSKGNSRKKGLTIIVRPQEEPASQISRKKAHRLFR